jgi:hypothetical protein
MGWIELAEEDASAQAPLLTNRQCANRMCLGWKVLVRRMSGVRCEMDGHRDEQHDWDDQNASFWTDGTSTKQFVTTHVRPDQISMYSIATVCDSV